MFPFILEDVSLVSQIYTMIQQFRPKQMDNSVNERRSEKTVFLLSSLTQIVWRRRFRPFSLSLLISLISAALSLIIFV